MLQEELTRVVPAPSNPPTLWWPDLRLTPWACQGAYTRKCLLHRQQVTQGVVEGGLAYLLYDADRVEGPGPGVSTEILRRLGPGGLEGPAGSSLGDRKSA